ncbi:hypothetical protein KSP40_PGU006679 [Platanthera guangdongensis]|uniref:Uncharacterized protein n=1 Tax=Platanthera guangdongensis TaxID=2320717 RepID=A0ABR2MZM9_9ASPA
MPSRSCVEGARLRAAAGPVGHTAAVAAGRRGIQPRARSAWLRGCGRRCGGQTTGLFWAWWCGGFVNHGVSGVDFGQPHLAPMTPLNLQARAGRLSEVGIEFVRSTSGWTATLLFMWMPVAQMWTNYLNPENIKGLSAFSMLLAMIGNGFMVPRALFIRDLMWFTGSTWGSFLHGWGNLLCMFIFNSIGRTFFLAATVGYFAWLAQTGRERTAVTSM